MKRIFSLQECEHSDIHLIGGKGAWLAELYKKKTRLPTTVCISSDAYFDFIRNNGLREKVYLELNRKEFNQMRWEEIWDASLRIRNLFLKTPLPDELYSELEHYITLKIGKSPVAVRSSAPEEDQQQASFAGLHDSFLGVRGIEQIIHCIKKVWSSLWSDRALLYRQELALAVDKSAMAVIIQELIEGDVSGICFTRDPINKEHMTLEAVYGLNQGLVDGDVEPDRWFLGQSGKKIINHIVPPKRAKFMVARDNSVTLADLPEKQRSQPPLDNTLVKIIGKEMARLHAVYEPHYGTPLDIEWTLLGNDLFILQMRPVTALHQGEEKDKRAWYLSLHRSFENLQSLRVSIEDKMLPQMEKEANDYSRIDLASLSDYELAEEIRTRLERSHYWTQQYWRDCIPFAHGIRLFGEIYNDVMMPNDPHEFVLLLRGEKMLSLKRNSLLGEIARLVATDDDIARQIKKGKLMEIVKEPFFTLASELIAQFGSYFSTHSKTDKSRDEMLSKVILEYSKLTDFKLSNSIEQQELLQQQFLLGLAASGYGVDGYELLELARASYRIRDDDNIYLGKIEEQAALAVDEGKKRLTGKAGYQWTENRKIAPEEIAVLLEGKSLAQHNEQKVNTQARAEMSKKHRARQLTGQPASSGVARGKARVIRNTHEIADFQADEVLVVDSVEPNMTFFAPLATAIIEQRGGMLIHGAIIAREYGIPCITGIAGATDFISTGDIVTVDGYLGIVTVD